VLVPWLPDRRCRRSLWARSAGVSARQATGTGSGRTSKKNRWIRKDFWRRRTAPDPLSMWLVTAA